MFFKKAVARDGRIGIGDVILKVNNIEMVDVPHQVAVDALKTAGSVVRLVSCIWELANAPLSRPPIVK